LRITRCCDGPFGAVSPFDADDRQHRVTVCQRVRQPLDEQHPDPLRPARAVGGTGERLAPAVHRHAALLAEVDEDIRCG
jgi:hypothetical protein